MAKHGEVLELLRKKFCPPLDEALFQALASDYDLENESSKLELESTLQSLKENAVIEQEVELLEVPIDTEHSHTPDRALSRDEQESCQSLDSLLQGGNIDGTVSSVTTGVSQLQPFVNTKGSEDGTRSTALDFGSDVRYMQHGSMENKRVWLKNMFPSVHEIQINESLAKSQGSFETAIDELLNLSFIHEDVEGSQKPSESVAKSIDGFAESSNPQRKRKGKQKKNRSRFGNSDYDYSDGAISSGTASPTINIWNAMSSDIDFLVLRVDSSPAMLKSIYHENTASLVKTIKSLIDKEACRYGKAQSEDANIQLQIEEIRFEFPSMSNAELYAALALTRFIPTTAKEVLEAMLTPVSKPPHHDTTILVPSYTPIDLSDNDENPSTKFRVPKARTNSGDPASLAQRASQHGVAAQLAANQASSAFKRGKSNHLYGGAAAYYASVYHENRKNQKELLSSASDALVAQQSTGTTLDLHGVTVEHAQRIARERVESWWEDLGDRKLMHAGIGEGFRIITGVGSHSSQGIARIGPAVTRALMKDGWQLNVQRGEIFVEGRR